MARMTRITASQASMGTGGEQVPSVQRSLRAQLIAIALTEPSCRTDIGQLKHGEWWEEDHSEIRGGLGAFLDVVKEPWRIPTEDELSAIGAHLPTLKSDAAANTRDMWQDRPRQFRFSAAAAAIIFLESLPASTRKHILRICLREDQVSVGYPESHIRGLVPYCLENPALQTAAWGYVSGEYFPPFGDPATFGLIDWTMEYGGSPDHGDIVHGLPARYATRPVALWMAEASDPKIPDSISLVLDGDPTRERSADVFREAIQRADAWQIAMERRFSNPEDALWIRREIGEWCWHAVRFPQLLGDINKPSSRIRFNSDLRQPWGDDQIAEIINTNKDAEDALVPTNRDRNGQPVPVEPSDAWQKAWSRRMDQHFATASPLPSFEHLLEQNMDPGYEELGYRAGLQARRWE